jgi:SAM-dependent methyltransferase
MRPRVRLANLLLDIGRSIITLAPMVMRPDDMVAFGAGSYAKPDELEHWSTKEVLNKGLFPLETALLEKVPVKSGDLLIMGVGGGREAIALAPLGFEVTGVDFLPAMVKNAVKNAAREGIRLKGLVQEFSALEMPENSYNLVWFSNRMYSCVPTRERRVRMLKRLHHALKPGGCFVCMFHCEKGRKFNPRKELTKKIFAIVTQGNLWYEPGDVLWANAEFLHGFSSEAELIAEFADGGFEVVYLHFLEKDYNGGAVLRVKK